LFGDFNIDEIFDNSAGYLNAVLFLIYLFVSVFIMLSMFFAILGESQANVRDDQTAARREGSDEPEYGVITYAWRYGVKAAGSLPLIGSRLGGGDDALQDFRGMEEGPTPVERIEARLYDMGLRMGDLDEKVAASFDALSERLSELSSLTRANAKDLPNTATAKELPRAGSRGGSSKAVSAKVSDAIRFTKAQVRNGKSRPSCGAVRVVASSTGYASADSMDDGGYDDYGYEYDDIDERKAKSRKVKSRKEQPPLALVGRGSSAKLRESGGVEAVPSSSKTKESSVGRRNDLHA